VDLRSDSGAKPSKGAHFVILNQTLGPFYRQTAVALAERGHRVTVISAATWAFEMPGITFVGGPAYDRTTIRSRLRSWTAFLRFVRTVLPDYANGAVLLSSSNPPLLPHMCSVTAPRDTPHVARILDLYPDVLRSHPRLANVPAVQWVWRLANRMAYRRCAAVVTLGEVMAETLGHSSEGETVVIPDWSTIDRSQVPPRETNPLRLELGLRDHLVVLYSGSIGATHDLGVLVSAAKHLSPDEPVKFVIIGAGPQHDRLRSAVQTNDVEQFFLFLPPQPFDKLPISMGLGDWAVVSIGRGAEATLMPCKTYDYLAAGAAILAVTKRPSDLASIVDRYSCGMVIEPGDVGSLVSAIRLALNDHSKFSEIRSNARRAAEVFSPAVQCAKLVALLEQVAQRGERDSTSSMTVPSRVLRVS